MIQQRSKVMVGGCGFELTCRDVPVAVLDEVLRELAGNGCRSRLAPIQPLGGGRERRNKINLKVPVLQWIKAFINLHSPPPCHKTSFNSRQSVAEPFQWRWSP